MKISTIALEWDDKNEGVPLEYCAIRKAYKIEKKSLLFGNQISCVIWGRVMANQKNSSPKDDCCRY